VIDVAGSADDDRGHLQSASLSGGS
jgi:hypothetical protein